MATTAELLLAWDQTRARSQQTEIGMSDVGGCRRRVGYALAGTPRTNPGSSVQAVLGTAIHAAVEQVFREMQARGEIPAEDLIEYEVRFAGVLGHLDRYDSVKLEVDDTKSTTQRWLDHIKVFGADKPHIWQVMLYAAALISQGRKVRWVVIDYIARDTGESYQVRMPFDPQAVRDALAWLDSVRAVPVDMLNRDYAPDTAWCQHCPFRDTCWGGAVDNRDPRSVLYVERPDAQRWARQLMQARKIIADGKELEAEAKGALDALRPDDPTLPVDIGLPDMALKWTVTTQHRVDTTAVRAEYAKAGVKPPTNPSTTVKLGFVCKEKKP